jgi:hypothetical protein
MKKVSSVIVLILTMCFVTTNVAAGNQSGGFSSAKQRYYVQYSKDYISLAILKKAVKRWDNASANVSLTYSGQKVSTKGITVSVGVFKPANEGDLGVTYYSYGGKKVSNSKTRDAAVCIVYANSSFVKNSNAIQATLMHEVGHALSLTHTNGNTDIMRQGIKNYKTLSSNDKKWLKKKWG